MAAANEIRASRRSFLKQTAVASGAMLAGGGVAATVGAAEIKAVSLEPESVVLLQGDSITDAGRDKRREGPNDPRALGFGYASMIAAGLLGAHPKLRLKCYNRGISGNKVPDLDARWQADCVDLKPTVVSILIGVNDIWHKLNGRYDGSIADYESGFTSLLDKTKKALPEVKLVICEPFALKCGAVGDHWYPEFDQRREAAARVVKAAGAIWVPFQKMFDEAIGEQAPPKYWAGDGVHPSMAGHALMAKTWLDATGLG
jgi:lysophospholipase L1-like esterase